MKRLLLACVPLLALVACDYDNGRDPNARYQLLGWSERTAYHTSCIYKDTETGATAKFVTTRYDCPGSLDSLELA